jgi:TPP-dependent 2-oxoacid decarboxylase
LYATIIAFDELLVNQSKSSTKVVLSRNHEINIMTNTEEKIMLANLLERLAEMFPGSDYQSRLEQYIATRHPQNTADVEMLERQYYQDRQRGLI